MFTLRCQIVVRFAFISALALPCSLPLQAVCPAIVTGATMRVALAPDKTVCVEIEALPGEIPQIVAQNPNDLILTLIGPDERKVDGFQFGNETITLDKPGHYRINLEVHNYPKGKAILPVSMSRHELSLQAAALWKSAEAMATTSKASRKLSDIQASLELWKVIGDASAIGRTKLKLGDAFHDAGDLVSALDAYEQALAGGD